MSETPFGFGFELIYEQRCYSHLWVYYNQNSNRWGVVSGNGNEKEFDESQTIEIIQRVIENDKFAPTHTLTEINNNAEFCFEQFIEMSLAYCLKGDLPDCLNEMKNIDEPIIISSSDNDDDPYEFGMFPDTPQGDLEYLSLIDAYIYDTNSSSDKHFDE